MKGGSVMDEILTVPEVAEKLRLHPLTVRKMFREGTLPAFKVGRQWRVSASMLVAWIERSSTHDQAEIVERVTKPGAKPEAGPKITDEQKEFSQELG